MYCVYVTFYKGNLLPPFYIGYTTVAKVESGYHGTVKSLAYMKIWKSELKNNPDLFKTKILSLHESRKDASSKETLLQRLLNVHTNPLYINRAINGECFYRKKGEYFHSEETKQKIGSANSIRMMGNIPWNKGKKNVYSEDTLDKIRYARANQTFPEDVNEKRSKALRGIPKSEEHKKALSEAAKRRIPKSGKDHPNYGRKVSEETKQKIRETLKKNREAKIHNQPFS